MTGIGEGDTISIGVIVPVYLGEAYLINLVARLESLRVKWAADGAPFRLNELILVDDAAKDASPEIVDQLNDEYSWITGIHLSRNFGQHAATIAGILYTSSDWVVTMDEDLQHPPEAIPMLLREGLSQSADIVFAKPENVVHGGIFRDVASRSVKRVMSWLMNNDDLPLINSFRLVRGEIARAAASVCSHDTYFDVALFWFTQRVVGTQMKLVDERHQTNRESGYSIVALVRHTRRMFFSNYIRPVNYLSLFGVSAFGFSVVAAIVLGVMRLTDQVPDYAAGWTSLMIWVAFFGALCVLMLGVALQYLSTLTLRAHGKPVFFTIDRSKDGLAKAYFDRVA